jgi:hypothetical protein
LLIGSQRPERVALGSQAETVKALVAQPAGDGICRPGQRERTLPVDVKLLARGDNEPLGNQGLEQFRNPLQASGPAGLIGQRDQGLDRLVQYRAQSPTS